MFNGCLWMIVDDCGCVWMFMDVYGLWTFMDVYGRYQIYLYQLVDDDGRMVDVSIADYGNMVV